MLSSITACRMLGSCPRNEAFASLEAADMNYFRSILPEPAVLTENLDSYNTDWWGTFKGNSSLVLKPKTTEQVSDILKYCNNRKLAVVPQGGNTGLSVGSIPIHDEIVLSLANMNKIIEFDQNSGIIRTEAGVILENLNSFANDQGYIVPLDLAAKGSCQIGGNLATNAGGVRVIRYGQLHGTVTGIEAVLPNGDILDSMHSMRKDNTGYDMKQLFIGAEGTLGIITKVAMMLAPKPLSQQLSLFAVESFEKCIELFRKMRYDLNEIISAVEFLDHESCEVVLDYVPSMQRPFAEKYPFYCLVETSGSNEEHDREKLENFLEAAFEGDVLDGVMAQDSSHFQQLWDLRELIAVASASKGVCVPLDVSLPLKVMYELVTQVRVLTGQNGTIAGFGHLGDCNLHICLIFPDKDTAAAMMKKITPLMNSFIQQHSGSVSAEHGIGYAKIKDLPYSKDPIQIEYMRQLKTLFDPNGIMNPYKIFPENN